jgi:F-type H+-transporting ATPase subunit gamma
MALKDIKAKIQSTNRTYKVTRAMEAVSAVKMRKTQGAALADRAYARAAVSILARISGSGDVKRHPLAVERPVKKTALVVITSDKGLTGGLNSGITKEAMVQISGRPKEDIIVYAYGKKGEEYFIRRGYAIEKSIENKTDDIPISVLQELGRDLAQGFEAGKFDEVIAVYNNFKSTFEQPPTARKLLPLSVPTITQLVVDIIPEKGKFSEIATIESPVAYEVEDSSAEIFSILVPRLVAVSLYHMLLEAKASEHSARMVAMKNASDKSKERIHDFTRLYNKIRQSAITREVSEIVSGREALAT